MSLPVLIVIFTVAGLNCWTLWFTSRTRRRYTRLTNELLTALKSLSDDYLVALAVLTALASDTRLPRPVLLQLQATMQRLHHAPQRFHS